MRNDDEIKGKGKEAIGGAKDKIGEWTNNPDLEAEGEAQKGEGKAQHEFGEGRRKVGDKIKDVGDKISR